MKNRFTPWCDGSWPWTALLVRAPLTPPRCSSWSRRPAPWCPRQPPAGWPASFCPCGCSGSANGPSRPADLEKTRRRGKGRGAGGGERYYTDRGGFTGLKFHSTHNRNLLWSGQFFFSFLSLYIKIFSKSSERGTVARCVYQRVIHADIHFLKTSGRDHSLTLTFIFHTAKNSLICHIPSHFTIIAIQLLAFHHLVIYTTIDSKTIGTLWKKAQKYSRGIFITHDDLNTELDCRNEISCNNSVFSPK